ncbi:sulfite exporter TauE/SafE family protein [Parafilimonas sp.]|uniref:sulfite exporter TauE/SafE family protein n=1 Tax=Parafilimonas sp. TaxID=1969739 RepID=UPI0039E58129
MMWQLIISAFALGLFSSFHCVGMCGAIAFSLPVNHLPQAKKIAGIALYNLGRITTYSIIGFLFGLIGRQLYIAGLQQWFSIIGGVIIILAVLQYVFRKPLLHLPGFNKIQLLIQNLIGRFLRAQNISELFLLGMANGLLPCGLVYFAVMGAVTTGSALNAVLFMALFGLGTLPAMFLFGYFGVSINVAMRNKMKQAVPYFLTIMGMLLILRGLGLGIPYISPVLPHPVQADAISCH